VWCGVRRAEFDGCCRKLQGAREVLIALPPPDAPFVEIIEAKEAVGLGIGRIDLDGALKKVPRFGSILVVEAGQ
jgi:hypothetical protein